MEEHKPLFVDEEHAAPPPPITKKEFERFDLTRRDYVFAGLIALSTLLLTAWGFWHGLMLGWTVSFVWLFSISTVYIFQKGVHITPFSAICGGLSVILSFVFSITTNGLVLFFSFVVSITLLFIWFGTTAADRNDCGDLGVLFTATAPVFRLGFRHIPTTTRSLFTGGKQGLTITKVLLGVAISIPALSIVIPLLMSSDAAFDGLATKLIVELGTTIELLIEGGILALFVVPYCISLRHRKLDKPVESTFEGLDGVVIGTVLSLLSLCYLAYLFSQLAYFFSSFGGFLPEGYTFTVAEYARRGFFEMSAIATINLTIIFTAQLLTRQQNGKMHVVLRTLCTFIAVFTLIVIATAVSKMVLYIKLFGMTELRITTTAFMLFLAIVFFSVILRLFIPRIKVLKTVVVTAGLVLVLLGVVDVDRVAADYNYHAYQRGWLDTIDVGAIYDLGDEGVPYILKLTYAADEEVSKQATTLMERYYTNGRVYTSCEKMYVSETTYWLKLGTQKTIEWTEWNLPAHRAGKALEQYVKDNPWLFSESEFANS